MSRQAERSESTRARLIAAAQDLFAERGFADVGTEEIVRRAEVTRGALYHHFADKRDLFRAVHEGIEAGLAEEIGARVAAEAEAGTDPREVLAIGARAFLDACERPEIARIALVESPAVLGWTEWREIDERYGLGLVTAALELGMEAGALRRRPVKPLAHLLLGAMGEAGMVIANADDAAAARREVEPALLGLLEGL
ncbi:MAG TPA: helix-turn-helix domain-containing protein [Solirubrobacterales bacterium]